jgi:sugar phosphate isomerase/epimerase
MAERFPVEAKADGYVPTIPTVLETVEIKHELGSWVVTLHSTYWTLPTNTDNWSSVCLPGHRHRGHAVGQLRRLAKHAPDKGAKFHIAPSPECMGARVRWTVYIENNE